MAHSDQQDKQTIDLVHSTNLNVPLDELVEPRSPRIELEEGPAGEVWHEDGAAGEVDQGGPVSCAVPEEPCRSLDMCGVQSASLDEDGRLQS